MQQLSRKVPISEGAHLRFLWLRQRPFCLLHLPELTFGAADGGLILRVILSRLGVLLASGKRTGNHLQMRAISMFTLCRALVSLPNCELNGDGLQAHHE